MVAIKRPAAEESEKVNATLTSSGRNYTRQGSYSCVCFFFLRFHSDYASGVSNNYLQLIF